MVGSFVPHQGLIWGDFPLGTERRQHTYGSRHDPTGVRLRLRLRPSIDGARMALTEAQATTVAAFYGDKFRDEAARVKSYGILESIVGLTPPTNTTVGLALLSKELATFSDQDFAFLLTHSGFIPDHYGDDSSEETLFSKLIEALVGEWGKRLGLGTTLPTAKSSTEDVTLIRDQEVIVADAKSFRLGRSQAAPNTKDAIKPEDYAKWIARHKEKTAVGGLTAFPSKFDWQKGSDVYLYASNALDGKRIMMLFYEHMAFMLLKKATLDVGSIFEILKQYNKLFPAPTKSRDAYWLAIDQAIQTATKSKDLGQFLAATTLVIDECVRKTIERITTRIKHVEGEERTRIEALDAALLREALIASEVERRTSQDRRRLDNIRRFRT